MPSAQCPVHVLRVKYFSIFTNRSPAAIRLTRHASQCEFNPFTTERMSRRNATDQIETSFNWNARALCVESPKTKPQITIGKCKFIRLSVNLRFAVCAHKFALWRLYIYTIRLQSSRFTRMTEDRRLNLLSFLVWFWAIAEFDYKSNGLRFGSFESFVFRLLLFSSSQFINKRLSRLSCQNTHVKFNSFFSLSWFKSNLHWIDYLLKNLN